MEYTIGRIEFGPPKGLELVNSRIAIDTSVDGKDLLQLQIRCAWIEAAYADLLAENTKLKQLVADLRTSAGHWEDCSCEICLRAHNGSERT